MFSGFKNDSWLISDDSNASFHPSGTIPVQWSSVKKSTVCASHICRFSWRNSYNAITFPCTISVQMAILKTTPNGNGRGQYIISLHHFVYLLYYWHAITLLRIFLYLLAYSLAGRRNIFPRIEDITTLWAKNRDIWWRQDYKPIQLIRQGVARIQVIQGMIW